MSDFKPTGLNYTKEEIEANGNQVPLGKLHDEVCDYMESEWKASESEILNISTALWKALEVLNNELIKKDERIKELEYYKEQWQSIAGKANLKNLVVTAEKYDEAVKDIEALLFLRERLKSKSVSFRAFAIMDSVHNPIKSKYGLDEQEK